MLRTTAESDYLFEIEKQLGLPQSRSSMFTLLKRAALLLQDVKQCPPTRTMKAVEACAGAFAIPALLHHWDEGVKMFVAFCITEILRIVAPFAPYNDAVLREIFRLFVGVFQGLRSTGSPFNPRRARILQSVAHTRSFLIMLDLGCNDVVRGMFHVFFNTVSEEHPHFIRKAMRDIMALLLVYEKGIWQPLLRTVASHLPKGGDFTAANGLAEAVIGTCGKHFADKFLMEARLSRVPTPGIH